MVLLNPILRGDPVRKIPEIAHMYVLQLSFLEHVPFEVTFEGYS